MNKQEMLDEIKEVLHDCQLEVKNYDGCKAQLATDMLESIEDKIEELEGE